MKRDFKVKKEKAFFIIFKGLLVATNCLRPEGAPLSYSLKPTKLTIKVTYPDFRNSSERFQKSRYYSVMYESE